MPSIQGSTTSSWPSVVPSDSVHGIGLQANYILRAKDFVLFFKYYDQYPAKPRPRGRAIVFGGSWTSKIPKPQAPTQK